MKRPWIFSVSRRAWFVSAVWIFLGFPLGAQERIDIKGSDTMLSLNQKLTEAYAAEVGGLRFSVEGKGSETGIRALIAGRVEVAAASRGMKDAEQRAFQEKAGVLPTEVVIGYDGLGVYVHTSNPVSRLGMDQLARIFSGEIRNWREVGGRNQGIDFYNRNVDSGTRAYVQDRVMGGRAFSALARDVDTSAHLVAAVSNNPRAIGYGGIAYSPGAKVLRLSARAGELASSPSAETVASGAYPLSRPLYYYLDPRKVGAGTRAYLDWTLSPAGQKVVEVVGFYPIPRNSPSRLPRPAEAAPGAKGTRLTPHNMERHGFKLVLGMVEGRRPGVKQINVLFAPSGRSVRELGELHLRVGEDVDVPVALSEDLSLRFSLRRDLVSRSSLGLLTRSGAAYEILLADFLALD